MIRALWRVKSNGTVYEPGEEIPRLSRLEEKELLAIGAIAIEGAEELHYFTEVSEDGKENSLDMLAFETALQSMKRPQLTAYAEKVKVDVKGVAKNAAICTLLKEDAEKNGIDFESFDDDSLFIFAKSLGLYKITGDMDREAVLDMIDARFDEDENE